MDSTKDSKSKRMGAELAEVYQAYGKVSSNKEAYSHEKICELSNALLKERENVWCEIFSYTPYTNGLLNKLSELLDNLEPNTKNKMPEMDFSVLPVASRALRDRATKENKKNFRNACVSFCSVLAKFDADLSMAKEIIYLLNRDFQFGKEKANLSRPYNEYKERVNSAYSLFASYRKKLFSSNIRLAIKIARKHHVGVVPFSDIVQYAMLGLDRAILLFDPSKDYKFSTYATWWVRHFVTRAIENECTDIRIPQYMIGIQRKIRAEYKKADKKGRPKPSPAMLSDELGFSVEKIEQAIGFMYTVDPLERKVSQSEGNEEVQTVHENLQYSQGYEEEIDKQKNTAKLLRAVDKLDDRSRFVIRNRFGLNKEGRELSLQEIGERLGITRERVRQIQVNVLKKLKPLMEK